MPTPFRMKLLQEAADRRRLVLVGGGHAQVYVLEAFAARPMPNVHITLLARDVLTPYSGMIPGYIAGHYTAEQCHIDLERLAHRAGAVVVNDEAVGLDVAGRMVHCLNGAPIPYEFVSLDIGSTPNLKGVPGAEALATPAKPISTLRHRWSAILDRVVREPGMFRFVTVGGGAAGVELTLAMRHRLRAFARRHRRDPDDYSFAVVSAGDVLHGHNASVRRRFRRILQKRGVALAEHDPVRAIVDDHVACASGRRFDYDELIWATEASGPAWLAGTGLQLDQSGFVVVDAALRSVSNPRVFAAGDVASNRDHPRPKAGVFAVRQGPPLAENLRRSLAGEPLVPFVPQTKFLSLISTGNKYAVASLGSLAMEGRLMWLLKDRIDRGWMRRWQKP
jgi:selenide,water dikinase